MFCSTQIFMVFPVASVYSWNPDYDYDYQDDYSDWPSFQYRNFPHGDRSRPFNRYAQTAPPSLPPPSRCNCIKMRDCAPLMTKLVTASLPLPMTLVKDLRRTSCGYAGIHPLVCCPFDMTVFRREVTTDKPWIWDVIDKRTTHPTKAQWQRNKHTKHVGPKETKKKHHFFEFEDPRTFRNCPPSFSHDFDMPHRFRNTVPVRVFNPLRINVDGMSPSDISNIRNVNEDIEPNLIFSSSNDISSTAIVFPTVSSVPAHKAHLINSQHCGISINTRIIGAEDAGPGQFPWMARLAYRNKCKCLLFVFSFFFLFSIALFSCSIIFSIGSGILSMFRFSD